MAEEEKTAPTATELLKAEVMRFLASNTPEVLAIRGSWGVGKTFAWNKYLREAKDNDKIKLPKYAAVSLFGVATLEELKHRIFQKTIETKDIGIEPSLQTLATNTEAVAKSVGRSTITDALKAFGFKNAADALQSLSFLSVSEQIICIDDIERKGKGLRIIDVLGLVSELKETRKCKVVLILNDEKLEKADDEDELKRYQEKVIDISLKFAPTEEDCVKIAIPERPGALDKLARSCISLGVSNIRIIKKIERLVLRVEPLLKNFNEAVLSQAVQTLTLFGWAYYSEKKSLIEFATKVRGVEWYGAGSDKQLNDEQKEYDAILDAYGFTNADEMDLTLLDGIYSGFFDDDRLVRNAEKLEEQHKAAADKVSMEVPYRLYHDSFDNNEKEVIEALTGQVKEFAKFMSVSHIVGTFNILKRLGKEDEARETLKFFIENSGNDRNFYDLSQNSFLHDQVDPEIQDAFQDKFDTYATTQDAHEILMRISEHDGWNPKDIAFLKKMTADDFYKLFKSHKGIDLRKLIRAALDFGKISPPQDDYKYIEKTAAEGLARIGQESKINRLRVETKYGIKVPPPDKEA
jgi:hypothetical protein